ncbi:prepilin-type N-terminal cleavage/methylation domain-containing protein [Candidatus Microgenomates bacterium]|jgi:prepilin-type N-terminal cleavage/methylation domain-containing protein|nr:MAG: prepilin-type N-terminal cleavage/methylation domain-containing protein [Candidatus Microgenomates bacterium]
MKRNHRNCPGFSLVELLIVISITAIVSSVSIASYIDFNRAQIVNQAAKKIVQDLRMAQSLAANNQKPSSGCGTLNAYMFSINHTTKAYTIIPVCTPAYSGSEIKTGSVSGVSLTGFTSASFKVLRQGVSMTGGNNLTVSGFGKQKVVVVDPGGAIYIQGE